MSTAEVSFGMANDEAREDAGVGWSVDRTGARTRKTGSRRAMWEAKCVGVEVFCDVEVVLAMGAM